MATKNINIESGKTVKKASIKSLEDLINLNLRTLEGVVDGDVDNKKAALIFTGSRTVTASLKLGLESIKLGMKSISGMPVGQTGKLVE